MQRLCSIPANTAEQTGTDAATNEGGSLPFDFMWCPTPLVRGDDAYKPGFPELYFVPVGVKEPEKVL